MQKLWEKVLNLFNYIGDHSGCHQMPERCFTVKGYTFPLCARCTGVFIGELAACICAMLGYVPKPVISFVMLAVMGIDWCLQWLGILESDNLRRFVTGLSGGFGFVSLCVNFILWIAEVIF